MNKTAFYAILIALVLGIVYVMQTAEHPPDTGMTQTPRQYIEQLERAKADKGSAATVDGSSETATAEAVSPQTGVEAQR
jgi:hypothetical protein